jgi:coproporphyrinogen III oxidase-like Fe-S oxidoreductase
VRRRNTPRLGRYLEALGAGLAPGRELEPLDGNVRARERVMLGLRLDEPLSLAGLDAALDADGLARVERLGLAERVADGRALTLTERGRFLGDAVTAELVV